MSFMCTRSRGTLPLSILCHPGNLVEPTHPSEPALDTTPSNAPRLTHSLLPVLWNSYIAGSLSLIVHIELLFVFHVSQQCHSTQSRKPQVTQFSYNYSPDVFLGQWSLDIPLHSELIKPEVCGLSLPTGSDWAHWLGPIYNVGEEHQKILIENSGYYRRRGGGGKLGKQINKMYESIIMKPFMMHANKKTNLKHGRGKLWSRNILCYQEC